MLSHRARRRAVGYQGRHEARGHGARRRRPRPGIHLHRADLPADETTTRHGIPTTTVPRTLLDLSAVVQRHELRSAVRQAEQQRLGGRLWLGDMVERYPRKPGMPAIRALIEEAQRGLGVVRSELEERFQAFLINAGLPLPATPAEIEKDLHRLLGLSLPHRSR